MDAQGHNGVHATKEININKEQLYITITSALFSTYLVLS